jgi:hypothetical protein
LHHKNYSLAALATRDASDDPFKSNSQKPSPKPEAGEGEMSDQKFHRQFAVGLKTELARVA